MNVNSFPWRASVVVLLLLVNACAAPDLKKEEEAIRVCMAQAERAHLQGDVDAFVSGFAPGMISVNKGKVVQRTGLENRERVKGYFGSVKILSWRSVHEPVIKFSDDASLAYVIEQRQVIVQPFGVSHALDTTNYAWVSIFRKHGGVWKVECNASTNQ